jgi:cyclopropane fatty-acyl-phospholipid synthase-like methyltransferase
MRCSGCGTVSLNPIPDEEALRAYYNETYVVPPEAYARGAAANAPVILRELTRSFPSNGRLLEIGCSYGLFLRAASQEGWDVTGIELDAAAASYGKEHLGLKILPGTLESEIPRLDPPYDVIAAFHVIEHVQDPIGFLKLCRQLLKAKGVLILKTPNVASWIAGTTGPYWQWLSPPAHIHLFSPQSLELALGKCGFEVNKIWSQRGDAHNNLFELAAAFGRYFGSRKQEHGSANRRKTWSERWEVNAALTVSDFIYYPLEVFVDPWLGSKGLQPELVAIGRS